jgi:hypothetical protein
MNRHIALLFLLVSGGVSAQMSCNKVGNYTYCNGPSGNVTCNDVNGYRYCSGPNGTVTCSQVGSYTYCNGPGLQPAQQAYRQPQPYQAPASSPADAFARGWQQGQQMRGDIQRARLHKLESTYYAGQVSYENRAKFLADVAKNGGNAEWYREDIEARHRAEMSEQSAGERASAGSTLTSDAAQQEIATLRAQLAEANAKLHRPEPAHAEPDLDYGSFSGRRSEWVGPNNSRKTTCGYLRSGKEYFVPFDGSISCPEQFMVSLTGH